MRGVTHLFRWRGLIGLGGGGLGGLLRILVGRGAFLTFGRLWFGCLGGNVL